MNRMTKERLAELEKFAERLPPTDQINSRLIEAINALKAERAKVAELEQRLGRHQDPETGQWLDSIDLYRFREMAAINDRKAAEAKVAELQKNHDRWEKIAKDERRRCNLLDGQLTTLQTAIDATGEVHPSWNTSKDFQDGWRECIAHIREDAERPATYFSRMRAELSELREGLEGLVQKWVCRADMLEQSAPPVLMCADELQSLITQSRPTVNSVGGVNAGENGGES